MLRKTMMGVVLAAAAAGGAGCGALLLAGAAGAGVAYAAGALEGMLPASPPKVVEAAEAVLKEMKLLAVAAKATEADGRVQARTAGDDKVDIKVNRKGDDVSEITIRVGIFGNEELSRTIYNRIEQRLKG